ncbi:MAG: hypothetical protein AMJ75_01635 [Phycisphaerae bacterium SM1_79]|nr:MAG: hypothetical protein AMJ75_01635 [Phycisphaerae bacterium SM1_79]
MADNDSNTIKPVESLQNIPVLTPAKRRDQRQQRQQQHKDNKEYSEEEKNILADEQDPDSELAESENGPNTIDYCA